MCTDTMYSEFEEVIYLACTLPYAVGVPQAGFTTFIRFSSNLERILSSDDLNGAIENIENVVSIKTEVLGKYSYLRCLFYLRYCSQ